MKKVLVFYENMGGGHKRAARIVEQALAGAEGVTVETAVASEFLGDPAGVTALGAIWNELLRRDLIGLTDALVNFGMRETWLPLGEALDSTKVFRALDASAPDVIVSAADVYNKTLGTWADIHRVPLVILETDLSVFIDLVHPSALHACLFDDVADAIRSFSFDSTFFSTRIVPETGTVERARYVASMFAEYLPDGRSIYRNIAPRRRAENQARCVTVGPLAPAQHFERRDPLEMKQRHGIDPDRPCLLVASGSIGGRYVRETVRDLLRTLPDGATVVAVCGRCERTLHDVAGLAVLNPRVTVVPLGFVDYFHELIAAADVVVARPSAGTVCEALLGRVPLVLPARVLSNDRGCVDLVRRHGLGQVYASGRDLPGVVDAVLAERERYVEAIERLLAPHPKTYEQLLARLRQIILTSPTRGASAAGPEVEEAAVCP